MRNFTLFSLFKIAIKHVFILIIAAVVAAAAAFSYCNYIATPKYSATGYVLITNGTIIVNEDQPETDANYGSISSSDISASSSLLNIAVDLLNNNGIYKELSRELDNKFSFENLASRATVARKNNSLLQISVSFTAPTPKEAVTLVNEFLELAPDYIGSYIQNSATSIIQSDKAYKTYPQTLTTTMLSAVAGAVLTYCVILIIYSANIVIQDEEDFKQRFDVPVMGCVPDFTHAKNNTYYYNKYYRRSGYYGYKKY